MEPTEALLSKINSVLENEVVQLDSNLLMWKEGSNYDTDVTNKQFDELERILQGIEGDVNYIVDLSVAQRPTPEMIQLVEKRLAPIAHRFKHTAVYTGKNYLMLIGINFYFIRFKFPDYKAYASYESALAAFN